MAPGHLPELFRSYQARSTPHEQFSQYSLILQRVGTLLMDLDALAGVVAYKHTGEGVATVTAAVSRISINRQLKEICDLELSGRVTYASGRSSMEISLEVAKAPQDVGRPSQDDVLISCVFVMVALDPATKKPVAVSPVVPATEEERLLFKRGEKTSKHRKEAARASLIKQTPNDEESNLIHDLWRRTLQWDDASDATRKPSSVQYMESTKIHATSIMSPQYRNRHQFMIFGGFLLKQTFELAFCCAAAFAHTRPKFLSLDPSTFENPVPVGSVLYLTAQIAYTDPFTGQPTADRGGPVKKYTRVQVRVDSRVRDVEHGLHRPTGTFNYTFSVDKELEIIPKTYSEFMIYIDARRRAQQVLESVKSRDLLHAQTGDEERVTE